MPSLSNIFWLGTKELRALGRDLMMILFIFWSFGVSIYMEATGGGETINNAAIAIVDEDHSQLSRAIAQLFYPPYFQAVDFISAAEITEAMDEGRYTIVLVIPPDFEKDSRSGRHVAVQVNVDATDAEQASLGAGYVQSMVTGEVASYLHATLPPAEPSPELVVRRAFNPNGTQAWFRSVLGLADQLSMLMIILTGAALLREREHGTIEHLLVMPLTAFEIALAKVWANGAVIILAFVCSLLFVVEALLKVPIAGSRLLLIGGAVIYVFAAAAIGVLLGTIARTMSQFALLMLMVIIPMMILSGGMLPVESQPQWVQYLTWLLPSRHYLTLVQAVAFRGAGFMLVWPELATVLLMGLLFLAASLFLFRRSIATTQ